MQRLITGLVVTGLLTAAAYAQSGNPGTMQPGTPQLVPVPSPHVPNTQDRLFVELAASGGLAEVQAGKLADGKGQSDAVKGFARRLVQDHAQANDKLAALAKAANIPLPAAPNADHRAMLARLEQVSGPQLDPVYIDGQIEEHQKTTQLLIWEIGSGQDPGLKGFAAETLPTILGHLRMAQDLKTQLTGAGLQGVSASTSGSGTGSALQPGGKPAAAQPGQPNR